MTLSAEEFLNIETRNEKRKVLRAEVSEGRWDYESFAWLEVESRPIKERSCILIRRKRWFDNILKQHGPDFLDKGTTEGNLKHARQPAHDGLYLEAALNDPIEADIQKLLAEIRRLRTDLPPPPATRGPQKRPKKRKATQGRDLPVGSRKGDKPIYDTEREFREWFEDNLDHFGFKRIILSQEACPDYVLETETGEILRVETELFAANFISHGHDPRQVDKIVACFSEEDHIGGIPVLAANNLREYNPRPVVTKMTSEDLSMNERRVLGIVMMSGGIELSALAQQGFAGNLFLYKRVPPELVKKLKGVRIQDSLLQAIGRDTRQFIRRFHHVLLGAGLSDELCDALKGLEMRELIALRPLDLLSALYDGILLDHEGWVPTEVYATKEAKLKYKVDAHGELIKR
jgi:hypothetical protein